MDLGELISKYRNEAGITLDELAEFSGVPKGTLNKIIAGTTKAPSFEAIRSIAHALGKSLSDFDGEDRVNPFGLSDRAIIVARFYDTVDAKGQGAIEAIASYEFEQVRKAELLSGPSIKDRFLKR